jgi:hypothetical protein
VAEFAHQPAVAERLELGERTQRLAEIDLLLTVLACHILPIGETALLATRRRSHR